MVLESGLVDLHEGEGGLVEGLGFGHGVEDVGDGGTVEGDVVECFGVGIEVELGLRGGSFEELHPLSGEGGLGFDEVGHVGWGQGEDVLDFEFLD